MSVGDEPEHAGGWQVVRRERLINNLWLRVDREDILLPQGRRVDGYFVVHQRDFAIVFAVTEADEVVLVRQYKHGVGRVVVELPAGYIETDDPSPAVAIGRELAEETGYATASIRPLGALVSDPTRSSQRGHVFLATGCRLTSAQRLDPNEQIEVILTPLATIADWVASGAIEVQSSIAAIFLGLVALRADAAGGGD